MHIYIIRHGKAEEDSKTGLDRDRVLKKRGHKQARWLAETLAQRSPRPELVISSPYTRAMETAGPIWAALGLPEACDDRLGADRTLSDAIDVLNDARGSVCVALVGHNPTFARMVSTLCNGLATMPAGLRTGEAAHVIVENEELIGNARLVERIRMD